MCRPRPMRFESSVKIHSVSGKDDTEAYSKVFSYRHFRAISTDWKYARSKPVPFEPDKHAFDDLLDMEFSSAGL